MGVRRETHIHRERDTQERRGDSPTLTLHLASRNDTTGSSPSAGFPSSALLFPKKRVRGCIRTTRPPSPCCSHLTRPLTSRSLGGAGEGEEVGGGGGSPTMLKASGAEEERGTQRSRACCLARGRRRSKASLFFSFVGGRFFDASHDGKEHTCPSPSIHRPPHHRTHRSPLE